MAPYRSLNEGVIVLQQGGSAEQAFEVFIGGFDTVIAFAFMVIIFVLITAVFAMIAGAALSTASLSGSKQNKASKFVLAAGACVGAICAIAIGPQVLVELGVPGAEAFNGINVFN